MDGMISVETISVDAMIGFIMPAVIAGVNQSYWNSRTKGLVAFLACLVASVAVCLFRGDMDWTNWQSTFLVVFGGAIATYRLWWQPSMIAGTIEAKTTSAHHDQEEEEEDPYAIRDVGHDGL